MGPQFASSTVVSQVSLACNGDPVELRLVAVVATREPIRGNELVKFICPRCHRTHESLRFRRSNAATAMFQALREGHAPLLAASVKSTADWCEANRSNHG